MALRAAGRRIARRARLHAPSLVFMAAGVAIVYGNLLNPYADTSHENLVTAMRTAAMVREIGAGVFPPMLFSETVGGAGHAFPTFYPPFGYAVPVLLAAVTGHPLLAANVGYFLSVLASAFALYAMACGFGTRRMAAVALALVYCTATYRLTNVYARGALAECWTFTWYPLLTLAAWRIAAGRRTPWVLLAVSSAGLLLTHAVMAMVFASWLAVLGGVIAWRRGAVGFGRYAAGGALGTGLAAWMLLPQQALIGMTHAGDAERMWSTWRHLELHRVRISQLFDSDPAAWGGLSVDGIGDTMSFAAGPLTWLLLAGVVVLLGAGIHRHARREAVALAGGAIALSILFTAFMVHPGWFRLLPDQLGYLQFPWRLLGPLTFLACAGLAVLARPAMRAWPSLRPVAIVLAVAALLAPEPHQTRRTLRLDVNPMNLEAVAVEQRARGLTEIGEYLPRSFPHLGVLDGYAVPLAAGGEPGVTWSRLSPVAAVLDVDAGREAVTVPLAAYPFWRARDESGTELPLADDGGFWRVEIPPRTRRIGFERTRPAVFLLGWALSVASLAALVVLAAGGRIRFRSCTRR